MIGAVVIAVDADAFMQEILAYVYDYSGGAGR